MKMETNEVVTNRQTPAAVATTTASAKSSDAASSAGKLTFGPACREEMLAIFETIERNLPVPKNLEDFDDLIKRDVQKPTLLTPPSLEEQKLLSTCVNSTAVLNIYNKSQVPSGAGGGGSSNSTGSTRTHTNSGGDSGRSGGGGGGGGMSTSGTSRGESSGGIRGNNSGTGVRGSGRGDGTKSVVMTGARGRGRSRPMDSSMQHIKNDDENGRSVIDSTASNRNSKVYTKHPGGGYQSRSNWEDREVVSVKPSSRTSNEDSWRARGAARGTANDVGGTNEDDEAEGAGGDRDDEEEGGAYEDNEPQNEDGSRSNKNEWRYSGAERKDWSQKSKYNSTATGSSGSSGTGTSGQTSGVVDKRQPPMDRRNYTTFNSEREPEWLDDDDDAEGGMTFDESGQFISVKKLKDKKTGGDEGGSNRRKTSRPVSMVSVPEETSKAESKPSEPVTVTASPVQASVQTPTPVQQQQPSPAPVPVPVPVPVQVPVVQQQSQSKEDAVAQLMAKATLQDQQVQQQLQQPDVNLDVKRGAVPLTHPDADKWLYLDPQNQIQGTFTSEEMAGWFTAGYFTLNLMVRRGCDEQFLPLGMVLKTWGRLPFTAGQQPPPLRSKDPFTLQMIQQLQNIQQMQLQMQQQQQQQQQAVPNAQNIFRPDLLQQSSVEATGGHLKDNQMMLHNLMQKQQQQQQVNTPDVLQKQQQEAFVNSLLLKQAAVLQAAMQQQQQQQHQLQVQQQLSMKSDHVTDPAILTAVSAASKSVWGDMPTTNKVTYSNALHRDDHTTTTTALLQQQQQHIQQQQANLLSVLAQQQQQQQQQQHALLQSNGAGAVFGQENLTDKIQAFFEQTKKDEDLRRLKQQEEEMKMKMMREDEEARRRMDEMRLKDEEEKKRMAEERLREELRKEEQRRRLEEIIRKQEEDRSKKLDVEIKRKKDEESRQKLESLKRKEDQRRLELEKQRLQQEELEKKRLTDKQQQQEFILKKQLEIEKQKQQKIQQELNSIQLPAHANWATANQTQAQQISLKQILEQQALESIERQRQLLEQHQKQQAELQASNTWSSLFRGQQASTPSLIDIQNEQAAATPVSSAQSDLFASTQQQQSNSAKYYQQQKQQQANLAKIISKQQQQQTSTAWAAWGSSGGSGGSVQTLNDPQFPLPSVTATAPTPAIATQSNAATVTNTTGNNSGFWNDIVAVNTERKPQPHTQSQPQPQQQVQQQSKNAKTPNHSHSQQQHHDHHRTTTATTTSGKHIKDEEAIAKSIFKPKLTISDEFMKWCHDGLKDFHADLHIPTFVQFLLEIETCNEIEEYVCNYLGDTPQAKEFAQHFYLSRENQISNSNYGNTQKNHYSNNNGNNSVSLSSSSSSSYNTDVGLKQKKQKKKGQPVDLQLLGFTVQPDPTLTNRGGIDQL